MRMFWPRLPEQHKHNHQPVTDLPYRPVQNWQNVIWREWYLCDDPDYAEHLYLALPRLSRGLFFWLKRLTLRQQSRPYAAEVEAALHVLGQKEWSGQHAWQRRLRRLSRARNNPAPLERQIANLQNYHWFARFIARHVLLYQGGEAVGALVTAQAESPSLQRIAGWLLVSISAETTERLGQGTDDWLCAQCLRRCQAYKVDLSGQPDLNYYGCRACRRSYGLLHCRQGVTAILNASGTQRYTQQDGRLRANWLVQRALFDFDSVEIIKATDEDVERFALQVGNDTDPLRRTHYEQMVCTIAPACSLSKNTIRILEQMFGQLNQLPITPIDKGVHHD